MSFWTQTREKWMTKKPKVSAEVAEAEFAIYKKAAAARGVTLSEWIRLKLEAPEGAEPVPEPPPPPSAPDMPAPHIITEPAPLPPPQLAKEGPPTPPPPALAANPLPAALTRHIPVAQLRSMLFESPSRLPAYQPPERPEGPQAQSLVASHPMPVPPRPPQAGAARQGPLEAPNARVVEAMRISNHPCMHLRPGAPGNLRDGECYGTCGSSAQPGRPCFWNPQAAKNCSAYHLKLTHVMAAGQQPRNYPSR